MLGQTFFLNDVIRVAETSRHARVVSLEPADDRVVLFDLDGDEGFSLVKADELVRMLTEKEAEVLDTHVFNQLPRKGAVSERRTNRRNSLMTFIQPLLDMGPELFDDRVRGSAVMKVAKLEGSPDRKTLHAALNRYFRFGMIPDAVVPGYVNCGGPNKPRKIGTAKLGRKRVHGTRQGTNVTEELDRIFEIGISRYFAKNGRISFAKARVLMLKEYCMDSRFDPATGRMVHTAKPLFQDDDFPTVRQIQYWYGKNVDRFAFKRERIGRKKYDRDLRGITGTAKSNVTGPGSRFEIDATVVNLYVVSEINEGLVIGRPVLYVVVDVFSKMIVGFYIGLEGPSWMGAMMALVNVVEDKVAFCAEYGVTIAAADWNCNSLSDEILGDRGEIAGKIIENLQNRHNVKVSTAQAHRPDWKGSVEKRFDLIDAEFRPFATGYVEPDFGERGAADPRLDAVWTIKDLVAAMIMVILRFNNHHKLVDYPRDREMIRDGVRAVPSELWEWGIARRQGRLKRTSVDAVKFAVMPEATASIRPKGIYFRGLLYTCDKAEGEKWFDAARQFGWGRKTISFDPRAARHIYVHDDDEVDGYVVCRLLPQFEHFEGASFAEVKKVLDDDKADTADRSVDEIEAEADLASFMEETEKRAKARAKGLPRRAPKDLKGIRGNHAAEKAGRRHDEAFNLGGGNPDDGETDNVHPIRPVGKASDDDVSEPSLSQRLRPKE